MICTKHISLAFVVAVAGLAFGCAADIDRTSGNELIEVASSPLPALGTGWIDEEIGCEDRLALRNEFRVASVDHGLVAAISAEGDILCIDTIEAVQAELVDEGCDDDASRLASRFEATKAAFCNTGEAPIGWRSGDPSPQPSCEGVEAQEPNSEGLDEGDPSPQPS